MSTGCRTSSSAWAVGSCEGKVWDCGVPDLAGWFNDLESGVNSFYPVENVIISVKTFCYDERQPSQNGRKNQSDFLEKSVWWWRSVSGPNPSSKLDKADSPVQLPHLLQALSLQQSYCFQSVYGRGGWHEGQGGKLLHVSVSVHAHERACTLLCAHMPTAQSCRPPRSHHPITATSDIINGHACSSSHMNAISKTNKNLLHGNWQIKVHFPLKEVHSHVCVCREGIPQLHCRRGKGHRTIIWPNFFPNRKWPVTASQGEYELAQVNRRSNR